MTAYCIYVKNPNAVSIPTSPNNTSPDPKCITPTNPDIAAIKATETIRPINLWFVTVSESILPSRSANVQLPRTIVKIV